MIQQLSNTPSYEPLLSKIDEISNIKKIRLSNKIVHQKLAELEELMDAYANDQASISPQELEELNEKIHVIEQRFLLNRLFLSYNFFAQIFSTIFPFSSSSHQPIKTIQNDLNQIQQNAESNHNIESNPQESVQIAQQLQQASSDEINTQGTITRLTPNLERGHLVDADNNVVYFYRQKITDKTRADIKNYNVKSGRISKWMSGIVKNPSKYLDDSSKLEALSKEMSFSIEYTTEFLTEISNLSNDEATKMYSMLQGLGEGANGFSGDEDYIIFASTDKMDSNIEFPTSHSIQDFISFSNKMLMSVGATNGSDKTTVHRGIFKSISSIFSNTKTNFKHHEGINVSGLSIPLHQFGMHCAANNNKKYMSVAPLPKMLNILKKNYGDTPNIKYGEDAENSEHYCKMKGFGIDDTPVLIKINQDNTSPWKKEI